MTPTTRLLVDEFDKRWEQGSSPEVAAFIADFSSDFREIEPTQLCQLAMIDLSRRWSSGDRRSASDYFSQFPALLSTPSSAVDLLFAEYILLDESDVEVSVSDYLDRYPQFSDELRRQIEFHRSFELQLLESDSFNASGNRSIDTSELRKTKIPGYEILMELGHGGLGIVYLARDIRLNRKVAIKMLLAGRFAPDTLLRRLRLEAEATARLQHPNIVQIYEVGEHEGIPFLVLEYIQGGTLTEWMQRRPQPPRAAASLLHDIAKTVQAAHDQGVIHRDLKPSNILIRDQSRSRDSDVVDSAPEVVSQAVRTGCTIDNLQIKIADFGLAKIVGAGEDKHSILATLSGDILGTAPYISPEQALGGSENITASTDIYALGAILYELLTGRPPFVGLQPMIVLRQVISDDPVPPSQLVRNIPKDLQTICLKCLEKIPSKRYLSAEDLAADLQRFGTNQPIIARNTSFLERTWRWCRRNPVRTSGLVSFVAILLLTAVFSSIYSINLEKQLTLTKDSQGRERQLKIDAQQQLIEANLANADSLQRSRQFGQRFTSLRAIESTQELGMSIELSEKQTSRIRNSIIASLALTDVQIVESFPNLSTVSNNEVVIDPTHTQIADLKDSNTAVIRRIRDNHEIARIDTARPNSRIVFSPDGQKIAIFKSVCRVYDLSNEHPELLFESTSRGPWTFSADSNRLIGTDTEGELRLVDLVNPDQSKSYGEFRGQLCIALSPDSQRVALWIDDSIQVVDLNTRQVVFRCQPPGVSGRTSFVWHPNSNVLAIGPYSEGIALWEISSGIRLKTIQHSGGDMDFCFFSNGNRMLTYDVWTRELIAWDVNHGEKELSERDLQLFAMAADKNGDGAIFQSLGDGQLARTVVLNSKIHQTLTPMHAANALASTVDLSYSRDGRFLALASYSKVSIFDAKTMGMLSQLITSSCYCQFDVDGSLITLNELGLHRWKLTESANAANPEWTHFDFGPPVLIATPAYYAPFDLANDGKYIVTPNGDGVSIWDVQAEREFRTTETQNDVRRVSIHRDGKIFASGGWNGGKACIWELQSGKLLRTLEEQSFACLVKFSPNGRQLATSTDKTIIWDTETWKERFRFQIAGISSTGVSICFSPDSSYFVCSDSLGQIHLFDTSNGRELALLKSQIQKKISDLEFSPDGKQLGAISGDGVVQLWNLDAIHDELSARHLGWRSDRLGSDDTLGNEVEGDGPVKPNHRFSVAFKVDEKFKRLETIETIRRATIAASKFEFGAARNAIARAIELNPTDAQSCNTLAWLMATGPIAIRDVEKAVEFAERANNDASISESTRALLLNTLGVTQYRAGRFQIAFDLLQKSLAIQPRDSQAFDLYFLAMCSLKLGDSVEAEKYFERAEVLKKEFSSTNSFEWQVELSEFANEARTLLKQFDRN